VIGRILAQAALSICVVTGAVNEVRADPCRNSAAALAKTEAELPAIDLTPPIHHALVCVSIETVTDFAKRVRTHITHCKNSPYAQKSAAWNQILTEQSTQFRQMKCRRTM
jgi:hypothetical protein